MEQSSFLSEVGVYVGRVREFDRVDWLVYIAWVGLMFGLVLATGGFLVSGRAAGAAFPAVAWWVPVGALIFAFSIAIDTVGHRTIYKREIQAAEGLVHGITIACGISSLRRASAPCVSLRTATSTHRVTRRSPTAPGCPCVSRRHPFMVP